MKTVSEQMNEILSEYSEDIKQETSKAIRETGKDAVQKLKSTSPKRPGGGKYARGWRSKTERGVGGVETVIVYNATDYQLTHLLESGHVVRNKYGTYGRAPAHVHIKPVEEWCQSELPEKIKMGVSKK